MHLLTLSPLKLRGMFSAATTVNFVVVKAMHFAASQLRVNVRLQTPSKLWRSVNLLLGRGKAVISASMNSASFSR